MAFPSVCYPDLVALSLYLLSLAYHGLAALPKRERTEKMEERHERNRDERSKAEGGYLPLRPLALRTWADAGLFRQY
jgi:hypothetical protein